MGSERQGINRRRNMKLQTKFYLGVIVTERGAEIRSVRSKHIGD